MAGWRRRAGGWVKGRRAGPRARRVRKTGPPPPGRARQGRGPGAGSKCGTKPRRIIQGGAAAAGARAAWPRGRAFKRERGARPNLGDGGPFSFVLVPRTDRVFERGACGLTADETWGCGAAARRAARARAAGAGADRAAARAAAPQEATSAREPRAPPHVQPRDPVPRRLFVFKRPGAGARAPRGRRTPRHATGARGPSRRRRRRARLHGACGGRLRPSARARGSARTACGGRRS